MSRNLHNFQSTICHAHIVFRNIVMLPLTFLQIQVSSLYLMKSIYLTISSVRRFQLHYAYWWLHLGRPHRLNTAARWMHQIGFADLASHSLRGRVLSLLLLLRRTQWFFVLWLMAFKSQFQKEPFDPHQSLHWNPYTLIYLILDLFHRTSTSWH